MKIPFLILSIYATLFLAKTVSGAEDIRSVPAICTSELKLPGKSNSFKRPGRILNIPPYFETYIADVGNSRLLIFNKNNVFTHEINFNGVISSPLDVAADTNGYIYALGYLKGNIKIAKIDFDGKFVESFDLHKLLNLKRVSISSISMGNNQLIYFVEETQNKIYALNTNGAIQNSFIVFHGKKEIKENEFLYGSIYTKDSLLYLPISNIAAFHIYSLNGAFQRSIGIKGNLAGQLNFPVSITVHDKIIYVLDKNRFNVVCYNQEGKFLGEFGGKGYNLGWFYYPNSIATNSEGIIFIAQTLNNRIQLCKTPELVYDNRNKFEISN